MEILLIGPDIKLSADGMIHTLPLEAKSVKSHHRKSSSPFCAGDYSDSEAYRSRKKGIYHRSSIHNDRSRNDAVVCLTCDRPSCDGEQMCFSQRKREMASLAEVNKRSGKHTIRGTKDAG